MPTVPYGSGPYGGLSPASSEGLLTYTTKSIVQNFMGLAIASSLDTHIEFLILSAEDIIDRYTGNGIVAKRRFLNRPELSDTPTASHIRIVGSPKPHNPILPFLTRINKWQRENREA